MEGQSPAFIRSLIPIIVGFVATRLAVDSNDPTLNLMIQAIVGYLYYVVVHTVELKYPKFGYLLGIAKTPAYSTKPAPSPGPGETVEAVVVPEETP